MNPLSSYEKCSFKLLIGSMPSYFLIIINILTPTITPFFFYVQIQQRPTNRLAYWHGLVCSLKSRFLKVTNVCLSTLVLLGFLLYSDAFGLISGSLKTPSGKQSSNFHKFIACARNYKEFFFFSIYRLQS